MSIELITGIALGIELLEDEDFGDQYLCIEVFFFRFMIPLNNQE